MYCQHVMLSMVRIEASRHPIALTRTDVDDGHKFNHIPLAKDALEAEV